MSKCSGSTVRLTFTRRLQCRKSPTAVSPSSMVESSTRSTCCRTTIRSRWSTSTSSSFISRRHWPGRPTWSTTTMSRRTSSACSTVVVAEPVPTSRTRSGPTRCVRTCRVTRRRTGSSTIADPSSTIKGRLRVSAPQAVRQNPDATVLTSAAWKIVGSSLSVEVVTYRGKRG
jgi:hypothetical protein